jgi:hypothetical protein
MQQRNIFSSIKPVLYNPAAHFPLAEKHWLEIPGSDK